MWVSFINEIQANKMLGQWQSSSYDIYQALFGGWLMLGVGNWWT